MKRIVVFIVAALVVFSFSSFTPGQTHKTPQSARTEQSKKKNSKGKTKPRKSRSNKGIHKPKVNRQAKKNTGKGMKL